MKGASNRIRSEALMEALTRLTSLWEEHGNATREQAIEVLKEEYAKRGLSPIKGSAEPSDLYDKELTSLYIMGKYGMGLEQQYPELFDSVFSVEIKIDQASELLISKGQSARDAVTALLGQMDGNTVARLLRMALTKIYFGFSDEELIRSLATAITQAFPDRSDDVNRFLKFYSAFTIAEAIEEGSVRDRVSKEALKHALALRLGKGKEIFPSDRYIAKIASDVFGVPTRVLRQILSLGPG